MAAVLYRFSCRHSTVCAVYIGIWGHTKSYLRSCESDNDGDSALTAEFSVKYI